jgi:Fimbrial assembly protein (PilN).
MYAVSLLPKEYVELRNASRRGKILLLAGITLIAALILALVILNLVSASLNQELESIRNSSDVLRERIEDLRPVEKMLNDVTALTSQVASIASSYPEWDSIIPEIGNAIPPTVFLTGLTADYSEGKATVVIQGRAPDHKTVSDIIDSLSEIDDFGEITCSFSTLDSTSGNIQFELNIPVNLTANVQTGGGSNES